MQSIIIYDHKNQKKQILDIELHCNYNMKLIYKCYRCITSNMNRVRYSHYKSKRGIIGTNRKIRVQKRTGRARLGSFKSPQLRGGSVKFGFSGNYNIDYHKRFASFKHINKKEKLMCMKQIMCNRIENSLVYIVDYSKVNKTSCAQNIIKILEVGNKKSIIVHSNSESIKAFNNMKFEIRHIDSFNCSDILNHYNCIFDKQSLQKINNKFNICPNFNL